MNSRNRFVAFAYHHASLLKRIGRFSSVITLMVMTLLLRFVLNAPNVFAAQTTPPHYAHGWYINNPDTSTYGAVYQMGYNDGIRDNRNCTNAAVILDFGQVYYKSGGSYGGYGTSTFASGNPFISDSVIVQVVERYADGWWHGVGSCPKVHIIIGLNNYAECRNGGSCNISTAGYQWGNVVNDVETWLFNQGWTGQINAYSGADMEQPANAPGNYYWDCATKTKSFVDGFNGHNPSGAQFFDFGTAWAPDDYPTSGCWAKSDVYHVAYGASANYPQPEIYTGAALTSWTTLGYTMTYQGVLTDCNQADEITGNTCYSSNAYSPTYAWQQLWSKITQSSLDYATNIKYQGQ